MSPSPPRSFLPAVALFLRHFSPVVLVSSATLALAWRISLGAWSWWDAAIVLALWALWPLQEWLIHVFILHFVPKTILGVKLDPLNAQKHRAHHREPNRIELVFVPWFSVATALPPLAVGAVLLIPSLPLAATLIAGYLVFAAHYEWAHYLAHIPYTPSLNYYRRICKMHTLHHFRNENYWFGVSRTLGDVVLRTDPDPRQTPMSETVRSLGIEA